MKVKIVGSFLSHYGAKKDAGINSDVMRKNAHDLIYDETKLRPVMVDDITRDLKVVCKLKQSETVLKAMLKEGAYRATVEYID